MMERAMVWWGAVMIITACASCACIGCKSPDGDGSASSTATAEKTKMIKIHMGEGEAEVLEKLGAKPCAVTTLGNEMTAYWPEADSTTCTSTSWGTKLTFSHGELSGFENLWSNVEVDVTQ